MHMLDIHSVQYTHTYMYIHIYIYEQQLRHQHEYCCFFFIAIHLFTLQPPHIQKWKQSICPFQLLFGRMTSVCGGWGSIIRTPSFGGQQALSVNHSTANISALLEQAWDKDITKAQTKILAFSEKENTFNGSSTFFRNMHLKYLAVHVKSANPQIPQNPIVTKPPEPDC